MRYGHKTVLFLALVSFSLPVRGQSNPEPSTADIFFLDLGIVIEPTTGNEQYSRFVKTTSDEVKLRVKKVESGSVYMAASKEMLAALQRIQARMDDLDSSFKSEINSLKSENQELRGMLAEYVRPPLQRPSRPQVDLADLEEDIEILQEIDDITDLPEMRTVPTMSSPPPPKQKPVRQVPLTFSPSLYMAGVMAYQKEDYESAIKNFLKLDLSHTDIATAANVLYWLADAYQQQGNYQVAIDVLDQLLRIESSDRIDDALVQKGLLYRKTGQENLALDAFLTVVRDYPDSDYLRLAQLEIKKAELIP
ncbi:MAG: tol-pal system YbgF family protein [Fidelibacterota bacterium]